MTGAIAVQADFTDAMMKGCRLTRANLRQARLTGANLENADLSGCNLTGADLAGAILIGAKLDLATTHGADLTKTLTEAARPEPGESEPRSRRLLDSAYALGRKRRPRRQARRSHRHGSAPDHASCRNRTLTALIAPGAMLYGVNLEGASLQGSNLAGCDLRSAKLGGADLRGVNLSGAKLNHADLRDAKLGPLMISERAAAAGAPGQCRGALRRFPRRRSAPGAPVGQRLCPMPISAMPICATPK